MDLAFTPYLYRHSVRKGIYDRCTYAVKTTGYTVSTTAEFTSGMKYRVYNFNSRDTLLGMDTDGNTRTVILNGN